MSHSFAIIVGVKDEERFRQFRLNHHEKMLSEIYKTSDVVNIWSVSMSFHNTWKSIQSGDRCYFAQYKQPFTMCGIVTRTSINKPPSVKVWGDTPRIRSMDHLIMFSDVDKISIPFNVLGRKINSNLSTPLSGLYLIDRYSNIEQKISNNIHLNENSDGPPNKKLEMTTKFDRNIKKVEQLKLIYSNRCQVCNYQIDLSPDQKYSEVHHLRPLKLGGDDDYDNMIVLCPTHHVEFDYNLIGINMDGKTLINKHNAKVGLLNLVKEHKLNPKNILFHLNEMRENELS